MSFWNFLQQNWIEMLTLVRQHLSLVLISTAIAVVIGIPTGILLSRNKALRNPVLGIANVMQTIPSLALFGFLIPLPLSVESVRQQRLSHSWFMRCSRSYGTRLLEFSASITMCERLRLRWE